LKPCLIFSHFLILAQHYVKPSWHVSSMFHKHHINAQCFFVKCLCAWCSFVKSQIFLKLIIPIKLNQMGYMNLKPHYFIVIVKSFPIRFASFQANMIWFLKLYFNGLTAFCNIYKNIYFYLHNAKSPYDWNLWNISKDTKINHLKHGKSKFLKHFATYQLIFTIQL
jgi:hypothetical protein